MLYRQSGQKVVKLLWGMSGYQESELILATLGRPAAPLMAALRRYLAEAHGARESDCYLIEDPLGPEGIANVAGPLTPTDEAVEEVLALGGGVRLDLELYVGPWEHDAILCAAPVGEDRVSFILKLASSVIDSMYRYRFLEDWNPEVKEGLLELCLGLTRAVRAPGFLFQRMDGDVLGPVTGPEIVAEQKVGVRDWRIAGSSSQLMTCEDLRRHEKSKSGKYIYSSKGFTVYDLAHPAIY